MRVPGRKPLLIAAGVLVICAVAMGLIVALASRPFTQGRAERLEHLLNATVEIKSFKQTYFPYAGYVAEAVIFRRQLSPGAPEKPFITVERLTVRSSYLGLFRNRISASGSGRRLARRITKQRYEPYIAPVRKIRVRSGRRVPRGK